MKKFDFGKTPRVRIAPSPTGWLHVGTARTALFNYLFAKHEGGKFILRVEDTDRTRSSAKYEKDIVESLRWLGVKWDEGPFRQSERGKSYSKYLEKLLKTGGAYYCFCSADELEAKRQEQMSRGEAPRYNGKCRGLSEKEVKKNLAEGKPCIIRFKAPGKKLSFHDLIRGKVEFDTSLFGDFAIAKDLKTPLYNFAVVVDDFEMKISHVIRGEDHLPNTPKQILLQEALEFPQPHYAHLPLILGSDRSKLSKRHGAVAVAEYRQMGYLPEALVNFMAFLGWNPDSEKEIYSLASLAKEFSLENVQKSGAVFNLKRLDYLNGFYLRGKSISRLADLCRPYLPKTSEIQLEKIVSLYQERLKKLSEIKELTSFFFQDKLKYDKNMLQWKSMTDKEIGQSLDKSYEILSDIEKRGWTRFELEKVLMPLAEKTGDRGELLWPLRVALTGQEASAPPFEVAEVLGKEKALERIKEARKLL